MTRTAAKQREIVPRSELVAEAYDRLRDWIITGRLAPGAPIIHPELADNQAATEAA